MIHTKGAIRRPWFIATPPVITSYSIHYTKLYDALHVHFLALPDFLGYSTMLEMAEVYPEQVRRGLRLQA